MKKLYYMAGTVVLTGFSLSADVVEAGAVSGGWERPFEFHAAGWFWLFLAGFAGILAGGLAGVLAGAVRKERRPWRKCSPAELRRGAFAGERVRTLQETCSAIGLFPFHCGRDGHPIIEGGTAGCWPLRDGHPVSPEEWVFPEDLPAFKAGWNALLAGREQEIVLNYRAAGGGGVRHYEMRVQSISSADGGFSGIIRDVTDLKAGEEMVEDTSFMFRSVLDSLPGYVFVKDAEDGFRYVLLNRKDHPFPDRKPEECIGRTDFELFSQENAARIRREDEEIARSGEDFCGISMLPFPDGRTRHMKVFKRLLVKANGSRLIVGIGMDVTRERELEIELERNIARLNSHIRDEQNFSRCLEIVSGADDFDAVVNAFLTELGVKSRADRCNIFLFDESDRTFSCTHEWCRSPELSRRAQLQKLDPETYSGFIDVLMEHRNVVVRDTLRPPRGLENLARRMAERGICSLLLSGIWREGRLLGIAGIDFVRASRNFTEEDFRRVSDAGNLFLLAYERNRRLDEVANSAAIQRQICDSIPIPVLLFDLDYNIVTVNPNATESTGRKESDLIGKKCYQVLCHCDEPPEWCPMKKTIAEGRRSRIDFTGHGREYIVTTEPVFDHEGRLVYVLEAALDISEQKTQARRLSMQNLLLSNAAAMAKITYFSGNANAEVRIIGGNTGLGFGLDESAPCRFTEWLVPEDRDEFERQRGELTSGSRRMIEMVCRSAATGERRSYRLQAMRDSGNAELYYGVLLDVTAEVTMEQERQELIKSLNNYVENERIINAGLSQIVLEEDFDRNVDEILRIIATQLGSDRAYFGVFGEDGLSYNFSHEWLNEGVKSLRDIGDPRFYAQFAKWYGRFKANELLTIPDIRNSEYAEVLSEPGCRTLMCAPVWVDRELCGILGIGFIRELREISELDRNILRSAARLIAISREHQVQRESLEALDRQNRLILASMPVPVCLFDGEGALIRCNPAAAALTGQTQDEMTSRPCNRSLCGFEEPPEYCPVRQVLNDGEPHMHDIMIGALECQVTAMPILDRNSRIINVLEILIDMSEINESKRRLEVAVKAAQAADQAKSSFLATMSHELRTPLNAVIGFSELLKADDLPRNERLEYTESINLAGNSLLNLINDVLDLSKIEAEQMEIVPQPTDMDKLFREIAAVFQYKIRAKNLYFRLECPKELPVMKLDGLRLRQILLNVIGNAVKFTEQGGITLIVDFRRKDGERGDLSIGIRDTGIGISPEAQSRIFLPFVQQDAVRDSRVFNGTGLGLAISRRLAIGMGGSLRVESGAGRGSTFIFELPDVAYSAERPAERPAGEAGPGAPLSRLKLLLVDDVPMNLRVLQAMAAKLGFDCVCAGSGDEALRILRGSGPFDAVLTDLWMPKMNGTELAELIVNDGRFGKMPVIAVTADTQLSSALPGSFHGVLLKPITPGMLEKVIRETLVCGGAGREAGR